MKSNLKIDFAVIATLDEEYRAVKEVFQLQESDLKSEKNFSYYYKKIEEVGVAFFKFTERGNLNSSSQTTEIINNFSPRFIILVGIAGGVKERINLGDVAVSDDLKYYEYKKISKEREELRDIPVEPPSNELKGIIQYVGEDWKDKIKTSRPDRKPKEETKVVHGLILSGETILSGKVPQYLLDKIISENPIAFETEAGGVAKAFYETTHRSDYIVIKGISDYVDVEESQALREKWRNYASEVAAAFSYGFILQATKMLYKEISKIREELEDYLKTVKKDFEEKNPIDGKSLSSYYVESSFKLTKGETWNKKDEEVKGEEWKVEDFLKDDKRWRIVIGASFGLGKTSFVKYLAYKLANLCLSNESECSYFPIVVNLSGLEDVKSCSVYNQENLDYFISNIIKENESRNVLLILDGLDEYEGEIKDLFNYITELHNKYEKVKVKVIVTSRLVDVPEEYVEEYVRSMPFQ